MTSLLNVLSMVSSTEVMLHTVSCCYDHVPGPQADASLRPKTQAIETCQTHGHRGQDRQLVPGYFYEDSAPYG